MIACNKYKSFAYVIFMEENDWTSKEKANIFCSVQKRTQQCLIKKQNVRQSDDIV